MPMPVPPRRGRLVRVARVGRRRLRRSERLGLAEEIDRPQLALRAVAHREVLLPEQARERVDERHSVEVEAQVAWLAHLTQDLGTALPADLSHDVRKRYPLGVHRDPVSVVGDDAHRLPCGERPGRERHRSDQEYTTADHAEVYDAASRAGKHVLFEKRPERRHGADCATRFPRVARSAAL